MNRCGVEIINEGWFIRGFTDAAAGDAKSPQAQMDIAERLGISWENWVTCSPE